MPLGEVSQLAVNQLVTVTCKVIKLGDICDMQSKSKTLKKQDCTVSDHEDTIRLVLWEDNCGRLKEGESYRLEKFRVREYGSIKYLSMSEDACIEKLDDIGEVVNCDGTDEIVEGNEVIEGEIIAVLDITEYDSCLICQGKVQRSNSISGECTKCKANIKMSRLKKSSSVRFMVEDANGTTHRLTAFTDQISKIIEDEHGSSIEDKMLSAPPMKFFWSGNSIIRAVQKSTQ